MNFYPPWAMPAGDFLSYRKLRLLYDKSLRQDAQLAEKKVAYRHRSRAKNAQSAFFYTKYKRKLRNRIFSGRKNML